MERSGSQKALLVFSVIEIVGGILALILGLMSFMGAGAVLGDASLIQGTNASQDQVAGVMVVLSGLCVVEGIWSLLCGFFGVRAANNNQKIMIVWIFCLIGVILAAIGIIAAIVNGKFSGHVWSLLGSLVFSAIMFIIANNIKNEAGK